MSFAQGAPNQKEDFQGLLQNSALNFIKSRTPAAERSSSTSTIVVNSILITCNEPSIISNGLCASISTKPLWVDTSYGWENWHWVRLSYLTNFLQLLSTRVRIQTCTETAVHMLHTPPGVLACGQVFFSPRCHNQLYNSNVMQLSTPMLLLNFVRY